MPRRVTLPGAAELFRGTSPESESTPNPSDVDQQVDAAIAEAADSALVTRTVGESERDDRRVRNTGRVRHDEKITVYVSTDELVALEQARLSLRSDHGVAVDRGRIVRAAVAIAMDQLGEHGDNAELVKRLRPQ